MTIDNLIFIIYQKKDVWINSAFHKKALRLEAWSLKVFLLQERFSILKIRHFIIILIRKFFEEIEEIKDYRKHEILKVDISNMIAFIEKLQSFNFS